MAGCSNPGQVGRRHRTVLHRGWQFAAMHGNRGQRVLCRRHDLRGIVHSRGDAVLFREADPPCRAVPAFRDRVGMHRVLFLHLGGHSQPATRETERSAPIGISPRRGVGGRRNDRGVGFRLTAHLREIMLRGLRNSARPANRFRQVTLSRCMGSCHHWRVLTAGKNRARGAQRVDEPVVDVAREQVARIECPGSAWWRMAGICS